MLSTNEDQSAIFNGWCEFLNYFDSSIKFQLSFINCAANRDSSYEHISIPMQGAILIQSALSTRICSETSSLRGIMA